MRELVAYARAHPGKLNFGSAGIGNSAHLAAALFAQVAGIDMVHVPYKGNPLAMTDLNAGQIQVLFDPVQTTLPQIKGGRMRPLAVTGKTRLPDLPTIAESGYPAYEFTVWYAFIAPAGTPCGADAPQHSGQRSGARCPSETALRRHGRRSDRIHARQLRGHGAGAIAVVGQDVRLSRNQAGVSAGHRRSTADAAPRKRRCESARLGSSAILRSMMPTPATLERFIARVEQNAHVEAIAEFYTPDASMQENRDPPRCGRDALMASEQKVMARASSLTSECIRPVLVSGDRVVIRWIFNFQWRDGSTTRMEELAYQRWEGERIAEETFFYDPAQRARVKPRLEPGR